MDRFVEWAVQHRVIIGVALLAPGLAASSWLAFTAILEEPAGRRPERPSGDPTVSPRNLKGRRA